MSEHTAESGLPETQRDYVLDGSPEAVAIVREARGLPPLSAESDAVTQWGVESPEGYVWTYRDPAIARIVSREQRKPVLRRTVTTTPWENDPDNVAYVLPPGIGDTA